MCLVANDQVELARVEAVLRLRNATNRLVGGEDYSHLARRVNAQRPPDALRVGCHRHMKLGYLRIFRLRAGFFVRADTDVAMLYLWIGLPRPFAHCLPQQRD